MIPKNLNTVDLINGLIEDAKISEIKKTLIALSSASQHQHFLTTLTLLFTGEQEVYQALTHTVNASKYMVDAFIDRIYLFPDDENLIVSVLFSVEDGVNDVVYIEQHFEVNEWLSLTDVIL